jgi:SAM-dependent methyltransferase
MFQKIRQCRCCGGDDLYTYMDLGNHPLANNYHQHPERKQEKFPLQVNLCKDCNHSQLSVVVEPEKMFSDYFYVSGTSDTFHRHCETLVNDILTAYKFGGIPRVLDIACNDGTLLNYFKQVECEVCGVDPASNLRPMTQAKNIDVLVDFWEEGASKLLHTKFDIITATNVFAHVHNPLEFLDECVNALDKDGVIVLEFPYGANMITNHEFDTIYHEHLSYFNVCSFINLINRLPCLRIVDVKSIPIHGGSIRFYLQVKSGWHDKKVYDMIKEEDSLGLHDEDTYRKFNIICTQNYTWLKNFIKDLHSQGKLVVGFGASAKGNTMLNTTGLNNSHIDYIVDDSPLKCFHLTPGSNIPIVPFSRLTSENRDFIVLMLAWNFREEIEAKINSYCSANHRFLYYVPEVFLQ